MLAPTLSTPRLTLRAHVREDFDFVASMWAEREVVRYIGAGVPLTRDEAWAKFQRFPGHWAMTGFGSWAIEEKATGRLIGEAGFIERNLVAGHPFAGIPELGYGVVPSAAGKGYVSEAVQRILEWGRDHFGPVRIIAVILPGNAASVRVVERCGFQPFEECDPDVRPRLLFERIL